MSKTRRTKATLTKEERKEHDRLYALAERGSALQIRRDGPHFIESVKGRNELRSHKQEERRQIERGHRMSGRRWVRFRKETKRAEREAARRLREAA